MSDADSHIVANGAVLRVEYAIQRDGTMPARDFVDSELTPQEQARLFAMIQHLAEVGEQGFHNDKLFKHERGDIWTFKSKRASGSKKKQKGGAKGHKGLFRIPCFRVGNIWVLTHGFWKPPKSKWPEQEFTRAETIRKECMQFKSWQEEHKR